MNHELLLDESGLETSLVLVAPAPYIPTLADPTMQMVGQPQQVLHQNNDSEQQEYHPQELVMSAMDCMHTAGTSMTVQVCSLPRST